MFKNVASQKISVFAFDTTTGAAKTGDAANITLYVSKDYGAVTVLTDTSAAEMDATNAKGWYLFDVAQAETNADALLFTGKSSTANISIVGQLIYTLPPNFTAASIDSNGRVDVIKVAGTTQTAGDIIGDTNDIQTRLPAALVSGRIDASVGAMAAAVLTATAIASDAITDAKVASDVTIASVTGAVGSVTGAVGSVTGAVGSVTGNVGGNVTGTIGGLTAAALKDFFDTDSTTTYASAVAGSVVKEIADNAGGSALTAADIADAVWDEDATGHQTQGSFGQAIGDPAADTNTIYGAVVTGAAGATVAADIIAVKAETASILTDTAEIGAAGAGLTNINLPNQTMDIVGNITGNLSGSVGSVTGAVGSVTAGVTVTTNNDKTGYALTSGERTAVADAMLDRDMATGTDSGSTTVRTVRQALRFLRNKFAIVAGTLTVYKEDDSTSSWTAAITTTAGDPVSSSDPAGP